MSVSRIKVARVYDGPRPDDVDAAVAVAGVSLLAT
jgi:hypothetical protein